MESKGSPELVSPRDNARKFDATAAGQKKLWDLIREHRGLLEVSKGQITSFRSTEDTIREGYKEIQENRGARVTNRSLITLAPMYDMTEEAFASCFSGKRVLDVGSGKSTVTQDLTTRGIETSVVSLDVDRDALRTIRGDRKVQGVAEALPFADDSFDDTFFTVSLPYWAVSHTQIDQFMSEALRVTKKGGHIHITPLDSFTNRPKLPKDVQGRGEKALSESLGWFGGTTEHNPEVIAALYDLESYFLTTLITLPEKHIADVSLHHAYRDIDEKYTIDEITSYPPSFATITVT